MNDHQDPQLNTIRRILSELSDVAEHSSLTGSLASGVKQAALSYNGALAFLTTHGSVPEGMFASLDPEAANYGEIGVQCRLLLAATTRSRREAENGFDDVVSLAPFLKSQDLADLVRERIGVAPVPTHLLAGLAPFLDSEMLGNLVRQRMGRPTPPVPPTPPARPAPEPPRADLAVVNEPDIRLSSVESQPETLETLAAQLRRPEVSAEDRQRIATRLAELAYEQASRALD